MHRTLLEKVGSFLFIFISILGFAQFGYAAPPGSTYAPAETLNPSCAPGSTNCTVRAPAAAAANSDITSLTGLTTTLTATQGGTGLGAYSPGDLLYASAVTILSRLASSTGGTFLQTSFLTGLPSWVATSSLGIALSDTTGTLGVNRGGSGATTFGQGWLYSSGGTATLAASTSPTVNYIVATSTTATSTFANGINITGGCLSLLGTCISVGSGASLAAANVWTALQQFTAGASTTQQSVFSKAYFGGTATSTFDSAGVLTLASSLGLTSGGTGTSTFANGGVVFSDGSKLTQDPSNFVWDNSNKRLGIATTSPTDPLDVNGVIGAVHLKGIGGTPSISAGAGAGGSPTISVRGTDIAGEITLTTGTLPTLSATVLTLTFAAPYASTPFISIVSANAVTALLSGATMVFPIISTSAISLTSGATALTAATVYKWDYIVIQ